MAFLSRAASPSLWPQRSSVCSATKLSGRGSAGTAMRKFTPTTTGRWLPRRFIGSTNGFANRKSVLGHTTCECCANIFFIGPHHRLDELVEAHLRHPPELRSRLARITMQVVDLGRPQISLVHLHELLPIEPELRKSDVEN